MALAENGNRVERRGDLPCDVDGAVASAITRKVGHSRQRPEAGVGGTNGNGECVGTETVGTPPLLSRGAYLAVLPHARPSACYPVCDAVNGNQYPFRGAQFVARGEEVGTGLYSVAYLRIGFGDKPPRGIVCSIPHLYGEAFHPRFDSSRAIADDV